MVLAPEPWRIGLAGAAANAAKFRGAQNTLPLWIFGAIRLGQQLPEVNVVVVAVLIFTVIPVYFAARLTGSGAVSRGSTAAELTAA